LRFLLRRHIENLPATAVNAELGGIGAEVHRSLDQALRIWGEASAGIESVGESGDLAATLAATSAQSGESWSGWHLLKRRAGFLRDDARQIVVHSKAIAQALQTIED
jgi:hypothetical protein